MFQIKPKNESFTTDCGLLKVLISHFNNEKINKIYYEYYFDNNENNEDKITTRLYLFNKIKDDNEKSHLIGKYILCILFDKINITNKKNIIDDNYDTYIDEINKVDNDILKNEINNRICEFFIDKIKKDHNNFEDIKNKLKIKILKKINNCNDIESMEKIIFGYFNSKKINYCAKTKKSNDYNVCEFLLLCYNHDVKIKNYICNKIKLTQGKSHFQIINDTLNLIKINLPDFDEIYKKFVMSEKNKEIKSEIICGLFLYFATNNLFNNNKEIILIDFINKIKNKINEQTNELDEINILMYYLQNTLNNNYIHQSNNVINYITNSIIIDKKIDFDNFIIKLINHNKLNDFKKKFIGEITQNILIKMNNNFDFDFYDDDVIGFLYRMKKKKIKLNGNNYKSLKSITNNIKNNDQKKDNVKYFY